MSYQQTLQDQLAELENLKCINGAMYFGAVKNPCDCGESKCINQQTYEQAIGELKTFLTSFAEKIAQSVREEDMEKVLRLEKEVKLAKDCIECSSVPQVFCRHSQGFNDALQEVGALLATLDKKAE